MHRLYKAALTLTALGLMLGSFRGFLALYDTGCDEPRQIYPCRVDSLPAPDRLALEEGIPVRSHRELQQLLEDFTS